MRNKTDFSNFDQFCLGCFSYTDLENVDPILNGGFSVLLKKTCRLDLLLVDDENNQEIGSSENINFRIMTNGPKSFPDVVRLELTSDNDLFFYYVLDLTELDFHKLKLTQNLTCEYPRFTDMLGKMINNIIDDPLIYSVRFLMKSDGTGCLKFLQNMDYKLLELVNLEFLQQSEDAVRNSITYRYNFLRSKVAIMEARFIEISNLLSIRNPVLLHYLQRRIQSQNKHN
ncbi:uncharacterized protein CMU_017670 [Cryptosporidium muris RN66]|uniref:Spindle assembly abnormal protein 6 N-terminal domain-containing protein n=1 Tax=Cryptosporidium muris (strain RN66) TaxID=441375 RepID=B6AD09_CRYMR|nr:uncharacterized protein CMU_017670 [Cryptosporidium muris RN66]EEA06013.1 hypothetical protein, conserved [Cryptosporidium muris RN66]|eukprot:XP_002140362.1 hypothetical protein [Cryptosporidium muris RN66]